LEGELSVFGYLQIAATACNMLFAALLLYLRWKLVLGPETPDVRVAQRDLLAETQRSYGRVLEEWDGGTVQLKGLPELLSKALTPSNI